MIGTTPTFGDVVSSVKDISIIAVMSLLIKAVWSGRGVYEHGKAFFERCNKHMDTMETNMKELMENHLTHIEADVQRMYASRVEGATHRDGDSRARAGEVES